MIAKDLLSHYPTKTIQQKENALKELIQEIALLGLSRTDFFKKAAFYGGTCLRLFYGLPRFSEDLDFALIAPSEDFDLAAYFPEIEKTFLSFGFKVSVSSRQKMEEGNIKSGFVKGGTLCHLLSVYPNDAEVKRIINNQITTVKLEVDTHPALGAAYEEKLSLFPLAHYIKCFDGPSLFSGKLHAVICRVWKNRTKGRDLYDYLYYLKQEIPFSLPYLRNKLIQSGKIAPDVECNDQLVKELLSERFEAINFKVAVNDVLPFIPDPHEVMLWNRALFIDTIPMLHIKNEG